MNISVFLGWLKQIFNSLSSFLSAPLLGDFSILSICSIIFAFAVVFRLLIAPFLGGSDTVKRKQKGSEDKYE